MIQPEIYCPHCNICLPSEHRMQNFSHAVPTVWNDLPADIRWSESFGRFRTELRTIYFRLASYLAGRTQHVCCGSSNSHPDDAQIYGFCRPGATAQLQDHMTACVDDVALWMQSNWLQLNTAKTEVLWCSSARWLHQIPSVPLTIRSNDVIPVSIVRDLGIYIDSDI